MLTHSRPSSFALSFALSFAVISLALSFRWFLIPVADCQQFVGEVLAKSLAVERSFPERAGGISEGGEPGNYRVDSAAEFIGVGVGAEEKAALGGDYFSHSSDIGADGGNAVTERLADHNRTPLRTAKQKQ